MNSKEREAVIFREELKVMRSGSKSWNQVVKVNIRLIMGCMTDRALGVRESKASDKLPIEVEGTCIGTKGDGKKKGGGRSDHQTYTSRKIPAMA
jgi:hypothetical protein